MARELTIDNPVLVIDGATFPCESVKVVEETVHIFGCGDGPEADLALPARTKLVIVLKPEDLQYHIVDGEHRFTYISAKTKNGKKGCWLFSDFDSDEPAAERG